MLSNEPLRELIHARAPESELRKYAIASGMRSLASDSERWVQAGKTTREEVLRVTGSIEELI